MDMTTGSATHMGAAPRPGPSGEGTPPVSHAQTRPTRSGGDAVHLRRMPPRAPLVGDSLRLPIRVSRKPRDEACRSLPTGLRLVVAALVLIIGGAGPLTACDRDAEEGEQVLRLALTNIITLDPAQVQDASSSFYIAHLFSGLVSLNEEFEIVPDLAERWDVSPDGRVYTFDLRQSATFHNGRLIRAEDVKYSLERAADRRTGSPVVNTYLGDIVGVREKLEGTAAEIVGVRARGDYTVEITIDQPKAYFLAKLTYPTAYIVDRENVEARPDWATSPNGSGPFMLNEWRPGELLVLARNEQYHGTKPKLREIQFIGVAPEVAAYEQGLLDIAHVGLNDVERISDPSQPLHRELQVAPDLSVAYLGFNVNAKPFDDVKVRQAFNHAISREKLVNVTLRQMAVPALGVLPPDLPGHNENVAGLEFDAGRARQLLAQSSYRESQNLPPLVLHTFGGGARPDPHILAIIEMYRQNLGVDIKIRQTDFGSFLTLLSERPEDVQMFFLSWVADYADPQNFLDVLFYSRSSENRTGYASAEVDRLLLQARTEQNRDVRLRLYQQIEQLIVEDAPWVPLWHGKEFVLVKPYVRGYRPALVVQPWLGRISIAGSPEGRMELPREQPQIPVPSAA
ncbi:MAG: hypothetical protein CL878_10210 [Dehalococcoidia bacterium]|nr:hypothetical protein [Dehalococcoidia bacterium]